MIGTHQSHPGLSPGAPVHVERIRVCACTDASVRLERRPAGVTTRQD